MFLVHFYDKSDEGINFLSAFLAEQATYKSGEKSRTTEEWDGMCSFSVPGSEAISS
jgi:hypothetical protein